MEAHILVIEDDPRVAELLQRGLTEQGYVLTVAYDGASGRKLALQHDYALLITDLMLPQCSGLEVVAAVRAQRPALPILMLTALGTTDDKVEGFDAGADDYLVKPFDFRELLARVRALLQRQGRTATAPTERLQYADLEVNLATKTVCRDGREIRLTPKEFRLLTYMVRHAERVLSRTEITEQVWDMHFDSGTNFIDVYINYLRKKVDRDFDEKLIHTRTGMGFVLRREP